VYSVSKQKLDRLLESFHRLGARLDAMPQFIKAQVLIDPEVIELKAAYLDVANEIIQRSANSVP
jgi:hypothetical protein